MLIIVDKEKLIALLRERGGAESAIIDYESIIGRAVDSAAGDICLAALHSGPSCDGTEERVMAGLRASGAKVY